MTAIAAGPRISYWPFALAIAFAPWLLFGLKIIVTAVNAPLPAVEAAISATLYSVPVCFVCWLALTGFSAMRGGLRQGLPALTGLAPLGLIYMVIVAGTDR